MNRTVKPRKKKSIEMTREETLYFIEELKKYHCLWDRNDEGHKDKHVRDTAWGELSVKLGYSADDLVEKWASLRSSMRQYRCTIRKRNAAGIDTRLPFIKWPYFSAMLFTVSEELEGLEDSPVIAPPTRIRLPRADQDEGEASPSKRTKLEDACMEESNSEELPTSSTTTKEVGDLVIKRVSTLRPTLKEDYSFRTESSAAKCHEHHEMFPNENNEHIRGSLSLIADIP
uniref:MADF domain-containing protein n=1 Tax=Anopheles coluzzii TaxID=1518534 RepID=A0A8W7P881_ANOCL